MINKERGGNICRRLFGLVWVGWLVACLLAWLKQIPFVGLGREHWRICVITIVYVSATLIMLSLMTDIFKGIFSVYNFPLQFYFAGSDC